MSQQGTTIIDFGAFPGAFEATVTITGQAGIDSSKLLEAWVIDTATVDHGTDEHHIDPPRVMAGSIVPGVGFTIFGYADQRYGSFGVQTDQAPRLYGKYSVAWVWN